MTKLSDRLAPKAAPPANESPSLSKLGAALASGSIPRGEMIEDFAGLGRAFVGMIGIRDAQRIEGECVSACAKLGISQDSIAHVTAFEAEKAIRWLALGVRDPDDQSKPFGTMSEWADMDPDRITRAWLQYGDVRESLAPEVIEIGLPLRDTIVAAISKKNASLLRSFGTHILVSYLLSTDVPPPTSPDSKSSTTDSPSDT
jgi:hypothetical protein